MLVLPVKNTSTLYQVYLLMCFAGKNCCKLCQVNDLPYLSSQGQ